MLIVSLKCLTCKQQNKYIRSKSIGNVEKINVCGTLISNLSYAEMKETFNERVRSGSKTRVCVTPVNCLVWAAENKDLQQLYNTADIVLCDGVPILWMAKMLGTPLKERLTGLDVLPKYLKECEKQGFSVFFFGAKEGVADALKNKTQALCPELEIAGTYCPPFRDKFSDEENTEFISIINTAQPDVLWVSLTAPKQDYWIRDNLPKLNVKLAVGVGGAFEVAAGLIKRSPVFMQKAGLEWLYRFGSEPKRLFYRYFIEAPRIFTVFLKQLKSRKKHLS